MSRGNILTLAKFTSAMGRRGILLLTITLLLASVSKAFAQSPFLHYTLYVDSSDLSGYTINIRIDHAPHRFKLAMATHHEYDDRYWRYVTNFHLAPPASFTREDSAVWAISTPTGKATVTYRIHLPPPAPLHFAHRPFLAPSGGLVGDLHSFMYLVEDINAPCTLTLRLPQGWQSASGLDSLTTETQLLDAPILVGHLQRWHFTTDNTPHEVAWLSANPTIPFDNSVLVPNIRRMVAACAEIFGRFPYKHYSFLLEDSSAGALEHSNSVTIGVAASELASKRSYIYEEIAHEFFHTWNGIAIHPSGYTELNYGAQQQSPDLWFSEGVTMFYADLLSRQTGMPVEDNTRLTHLAALITRYYADTGNTLLSPARVSLASNLQPGPLGDYNASTHLQGELLGLCLDILIRDATDGRRSLNDVMQEMFERFGGKGPFGDTAIETAATDVCGCEEVRQFSRIHIDDGEAIDFAPVLHRLGLRIAHGQTPATDPYGRPLPDTRVSSWVRRDDTSVRMLVTNPNSCWGKADLHTGDIIAGINGRPMHTRQDFASAIRALRLGDTAIFSVKKQATLEDHAVLISGYTKPVISITEDPSATLKQQQMLRSWLAAADPKK